MGEIIAFVLPVLVCSAICIGIRIYSIKKKTPMHFWAGTTVKTEEIFDVKSYNKENGIMWITYGATYILSAILALLFGNMIGAIVMSLTSTVGLIALILVYKGIYEKYKIKRNK